MGAVGMSGSPNSQPVDSDSSSLLQFKLSAAPLLLVGRLERQLPSTRRPLQSVHQVEGKILSGERNLFDSQASFSVLFISIYCCYYYYYYYYNIIFLCFITILLLLMSFKEEAAV